MNLKPSHFSFSPDRDVWEFICEEDGLKASLLSPGWDSWCQYGHTWHTCHVTHEADITWPVICQHLSALEPAWPWLSICCCCYIQTLLSIYDTSAVAVNHLSLSLSRTYFPFYREAGTLELVDSTGRLKQDLSNPLKIKWMSLGFILPEWPEWWFMKWFI